MDKIIDSPFVDGHAVLNKEIKTREFRKETFRVWEHFYVCQTTGRTFTNSAIDQININQVYNQYRERHGVLFPVQITQLREGYGLNLVQMSKILGLGVNMIRNYENGEMPSTSNATLLDVIRNPKVFKAIFQKRSEELNIGEKKRKKVYENIDKLIDSNGEAYDPCIPKVELPNEYTGYILPDFEKFSYMAIFFLSQLNYLFKTKLNKLLFYADFYHFKQTGKSISGMQYAAISLGPVPNKYLHLYASMSDQKYVEQVLLESKEFDQDLEKMSPLKKFNEAIFSMEEQNVLATILNELGYKTRKEVVQISHDEKCWQEQNTQNGLISYQKYAFELKGINAP